MTTLSITNNSAKAACDAVVDRVDLGSGTASGHVKIYSGTAPADADTALSGNTLLADLAMTNPAFGNAADLNPGARATASTITDDTDADATGTATFFRVVDRDGNVVFQGDVGTASATCILNSTAIQIHATVKITSMTVTMPES